MEISNNNITQFQKTVREHSEYDFNDYSVNSLKRRLSRIMEDYGTEFNNLIQTISTDDIALEEIVKKITVNTTELFRDTNIWQSILNHLLPKFKNHSTINIWHPGCSTGQEVYSMMIMLDQAGLLENSNIYASDINTDVLDLARQGTYRLRFNREYIDNFNTIFSSGKENKPTVSFSSYEKYFKVDESRDKIQMLDFLKNKPAFSKIDLVKDENLFAVKYDLIVCRNVIIYFNYDLQNRVLAMFHRNMSDNGYLILGMHESIIGPGTNLFCKEEPFYVKKKV